VHHFDFDHPSFSGLDVDAVQMSELRQQYVNALRKVDKWPYEALLVFSRS
jgi:hypothetical protein